MLKFVMPDDDLDYTVAYLDYMHKLRIKFVNLNEGYNGDYNPDDSDDCQLLRFDVYYKRDGDYEAVEDSSYCTQMPVGTAPEVIFKRALEMAYVLWDALVNDGNVKSICEGHSWMNEARNPIMQW